jgi:4-phospho-D-threonate 3-dehydrogenase / 4-phospho-D-erythronate 3-dehydrogenase
MTVPARLGITMGDPSGIGPEIIVKALADMSPEERSTAAVVGHLDLLKHADAVVGSKLRFNTDYLNAAPGDVPVVHVDSKGVDTLKIGVISEAGGEAAYRYIERAVSLALAGEIGVIVTAPLNKGALHAAGHHFDGHTELLATLTGTKQSWMLLASEKLSALHVSTHTSLRNATERATTQRVLDTIRTGHRHYVSIGIPHPRIAVAGLNPHCGEGGIFGREEIDQINGAVTAAKAEGIDARGPISGDTVFYRALRGEFDLVIAQYHDQGHIPTKLIAFDTTVNVTLGLPIRRTSVDHGTAFDIAGTGRADHTNMQSAIAYARRMTSRAAA